MQSIRLNLNTASLLIVTLLLGTGCTSTVEAPPKADIGTVTLDIDFPKEAQQTDLNLQVGCAEGSTVFDILQRAEKKGDLKVELSTNVVQELSSIFVKGFNGLSGAGGEYWTFYVNDGLAKESCGTCVVKPDDKIRWVYGQPPAELQ